MDPSVTIGIAAYNCENTIAAAISSVLDQSYSNLNIIVVDDYSDDSTNEIIEKYKRLDHRVKSIRNTTGFCNKISISPEGVFIYKFCISILKRFPSQE